MKPTPKKRSSQPLPTGTPFRSNSTRSSVLSSTLPALLKSKTFNDGKVLVYWEHVDKAGWCVCCKGPEQGRWVAVIRLAMTNMVSEVRLCPDHLQTLEEHIHEMNSPRATRHLNLRSK